jgi:thiol-disulfide isomerase/thioredoxin
MIDRSHSIVQATGRKNSVASIHRRSRLFLLLVALSALTLFIGACGGGAQTDTDDQTTVAFEDLPEGMGRGYPTVSLEGIDNAKNGTNSGDHAADFALVLEDGRQLRLSDLEGRPVMLNFWATWCPPCRQEMPDIIKAYEAGDDLVVLSIDERENIDAVKPFAEAFGISMPMVIPRLIKSLGERTSHLVSAELVMNLGTEYLSTSCQVLIMKRRSWTLS